MSSLTSAWSRLPVLFTAVVIGGLVASAGTLPWAAIFYLNVQFLPSIPWSIPVMAVYLWYFWKYVNGAGWPKSTQDARRVLCRARPLNDEVWGATIGAGILGFISLFIFSSLLGRVVVLPSAHADDLSNIPTFTLLLGVLMGSIVAGVVEESAFRGYMQGPIERRHGPVVAILITGLAFGFVHFTHAEVTVALLPFYLFVAAVYGAMAYLSGSILPGVVLHAVGNIMGAFQYFATGRTEWQGTPVQKPLIWETGPDALFVVGLVALAIMCTITVLAFRSLARVARLSADRPHP